MSLNYVMLPSIDNTKEVQPKPWYKEKYKQKYLNKTNKNRERIIDPKSWTFVKDGLDDFRDGFPPPHDDILIKPNKGPSVALKNEKWKVKENVISPSSRFTERQLFYSKKNPIAEAKKDNIDNLVHQIEQHPLAIYSHLEESLPPDLYEEVAELLDPEFKVKENDGTKSNRYSDDINNRKNIRDEMLRLEDQLKEATLAKKYENHQKNTSKNHFKWLLKKEEAREKAKGADIEQVRAQAIDNHIKHVTEDFCEWIKDLGGEHNIDPVTLTSLFASGYDTKPPLSVPIHVVELNNIPQELRPAAYVPPEVVSSNSEMDNIYRDSENLSRKKVNYRYGAWYLPREFWKCPANEKIVDPKQKTDPEKEEAKRKVEEMNARLAPLHGAQAFKEFVRSKQPNRPPKLVEELDKWQQEQQASSTQ